MVKLQRETPVSCTFGSAWFPLWHGKVATLSLQAGLHSGTEFPLWHGKVATKSPALRNPASMCFRFGMVKLQRVGGRTSPRQRRLCFRFGMVKLQLCHCERRRASRSSFRFGMVKLQLTQKTVASEDKKRFRFGMVKLQLAMFGDVDKTGEPFPLWHGKVATPDCPGIA